MDNAPPIGIKPRYIVIHMNAHMKRTQLTLLLL
jgi:hypothetical protein